MDKTMLYSKMNLSFLQDIKTNKDRNILALSNAHPVLVIFLRHFGCIFCRASIKELSKKRASFEEKGVQMVFVHMSDNETADRYFEEYGFANAEHISDPDTHLYSQFGLTKGSFNQLFGLKNWINGFDAVTKGISFSLKQVGDGLQMPGVFLLYKGSIEDSYIHVYASDKPDYDKIINCCIN